MSARNCVVCGSRIPIGVGHQHAGVKQYCSNACRQRAYRSRTAARRIDHGSTGRADRRPARPVAVPAGFPACLDRFVGRQRELHWLRDHRQSPVVTLTGAPGAGKSRLAARFAETLMADDTVLGWLDLDQVGSDDEVAGWACDTLRVPGDSAVDLVAGLRDRDGLVVFDHAERSLDGCALLVQTLAVECPQLRILTTSREILRIPGEVVLDVGPLPLPDTAGGEADPRAVLRADAVQLFVERASASNPDFVLGEATALAVADLCLELDGLPLALEFAARRIGMFTVTDLLARLRRRENVLTVGSRTASARHSSIYTAFDASHGTLSVAERAAFRRVSVLSGRFGLDLAAAVCCDTDQAESGLADVLSGLLAKSLIASEKDERGTGVFRLLRCVRRYAAQKLDEAGERAATGGRLVAWLDGQLRRMRHSVATPGELLLRLPELDSYLEHTAEAAMKDDDPRSVLLVWGVMRGRRGKALAPRTEHLVRHALRMAPKSGADHALLLTELANARRAAGRSGEAVELAEQAVAVARQVTAAVPRALLELAACYRDTGYYVEATANARAALAIAEQSDPFAGVSRCLVNLAATRLAAGELEPAKEAADAALRVAQSADEWTQVCALCTASDVALALGRLEVARTHALDALRSCPTEPALLPTPLNRLALVEMMRGDRGRAVRLTEAARALLGRSGFAGLGTADRSAELPADWRDEGEVSLVRAAAEDLSPTAARAYALGESGTEAAANEFASAQLSPRQRLIATLVAQGLTNRQIGKRVGVSARTVATQLATLRSALRLQSRAQVAAWARTTLQ